MSDTDDYDDEFNDDDFPEVRRAKARQKPCRPRIDVLATPNRHKMLVLWQEYAKNFPPKKKKHIKMLLQELYSMSPEDTEAYFEQLRKEAKRRAIRERAREKLQNKFRKKMQRKQKEKAYRFFAKLLIAGMRYAFYHSLPPLISIRLKHMSDVILEQLCEFRNISVPERSTDDKLGMFLIAVADWFAIALERIFFLVHVKKNQALEEIDERERKKAIAAKQEKKRREEEEKAMDEVEPEVIETEIKVHELGEEEEEEMSQRQE